MVQIQGPHCIPTSWSSTLCPFACCLTDRRRRPCGWPSRGRRLRMQRWKAAALASVLCSSVLSIWMCREGLLLGHRLGPALAPLRRPPRTLDARIARLAQCKPSPAPCLESDTPNIAATIMVERCIQWSGATEAYFRWGGGRVQIPSTAWQGCQRGWLLGTGVPRLSCHKELGSSPEIGRAHV